jgi:hypothetical protein
MNIYNGKQRPMSSDSTHTIQTVINLGNTIRRATYTVAIYIQTHQASVIVFVWI